MNTKAYRVNTKKKQIIINDSVETTELDEKDINRYVAAGYTIRHKSQERSKAAAERMKKDGNNLKDSDILAELEKDKDLKEKYISIKKAKGKGGGFFAARKWYIETVLNKKENK